MAIQLSTDNQFDIGWIDKPKGFEQISNNKLKNINHKNKPLDKTNIESINNCQVIMVLAGGLDNTGVIHEWVKRRLDLTITVANNFPDAKIVCLGGGTYHKPPIINLNGFIIHESTACCQYLIYNGINPQRIYKEWASYDTIANGYFALTNFTIPRKFVDHVIITSDFHLARTMYIFKWIYGMSGVNVNMKFIGASDINLDNSIIEMRKIREAKSLLNLIEISKTVNTFENFHEWLYTEHKAYNSIDQTDECELDEKTAKSY